MKKLTVIIAACAAFVFPPCCQPSAYAQDKIVNKPAINRISDPETLAQELTDRMNDELKLTDKQYKKVYKLNLKEAKAMAEDVKPAGREGGMPGMGGPGMGRRGGMPPGMKPGGERGLRPNMDKNDTDSGKKAEEMKKRSEKMEKKMKKILDDEQYGKWKDMMKKRDEQMKRQLELRRQRMELGLSEDAE